MHNFDLTTLCIRLIIILALRVLETAAEKIGDPMQITDALAQAPSAVSPSVAPYICHTRGTSHHMVQLTAGCCSRLFYATPEDDPLFNQEHIVQFLSIKKVNNPGGSDRYGIVMSDGIHFILAMLATQLNSLVNDNSIGKNTVAVIEKLTCNYVQEKRYAKRSGCTAFI